MSTATDRGWGTPDAPHGDAYRRSNVVKVTVGPFPKSEHLASAHGAVTIYVHRAIAYLATGFLTQIITNGYRLDHGPLDDWGFCYRPNRNNAHVLSNHSWGIAIDVNAATNPNTHDSKVHTDMPMWVIEAGHTWGFSWGGDYHGTVRDPMHYEFMGTLADAIRLTDRIQKFLKVAA